jgi:hypothetical protein
LAGLRRCSFWASGYAAGSLGGLKATQLDAIRIADIYRSASIRKLCAACPNQRVEV